VTPFSQNPSSALQRHAVHALRLHLNLIMSGDDDGGKDCAVHGEDLAVVPEQKRAHLSREALNASGLALIVSMKLWKLSTTSNSARSPPLR
jgi:hypothetical protein